MNEDASTDKSDWLDAKTHALARSAIQRCHGVGGTLEAAGRVVQAAVVDARGEIVGAKCVLVILYIAPKIPITDLYLQIDSWHRSHLKSALSLLILAGENHLCVLLLTQVGAQYLHTAPAHAMETLVVCATLGAGMGAK